MQNEMVKKQAAGDKKKTTAPEVGAVLEGKVTGITSFGAFVELPGGKSGLVHISEVATEYVDDVSKHLKKGQTVKVKVIGLEKGKISLSIKQLEADNRSEKGKFKAKGGKEKRNNGRIGRQAPEEFEFVRKKDPENMSFDDMLQKFKHDSDEKFQDLKRSADNKRSGGYRRAY